MSLGALLGCSPMTVLAAETAAEGSAAVPFWLCVPFAGLLLCIALFPLLKPVWWENHQPYAVIFWSLLFIIPYALSFSAGTALETVLECMINDYLTFIILLFGLFCVSGNITMTGDLAGSPRINVGLLVLGTLLSSWIGSQHADGPSGDQDELLEKKKTPYYRVLHFPGVQYRRRADAHRRSAPSDGIHAGRSFLLEP